MQAREHWYLGPQERLTLAHLQAVDPGSPEGHVAHIHIAQVRGDDGASNGLRHTK